MEKSSGKTDHLFSWVTNKELRAEMLKDYAWLTENQKRYDDYIEWFLDEYHDQLARTIWSIDDIKNKDL